MLHCPPQTSPLPTHTRYHTSNQPHLLATTAAVPCRAQFLGQVLQQLLLFHSGHWRRGSCRREGQLECMLALFMGVPGVEQCGPSDPGSMGHLQAPVRQEVRVCCGCGGPREQACSRCSSHRRCHPSLQHPCTIPQLFLSANCMCRAASFFFATAQALDYGVQARGPNATSQGDNVEKGERASGKLFTQLCWIERL